MGEVVTDEMAEAAARVVAERAGEDYDYIGEFAQGVLLDTQRAAIDAALASRPAIDPSMLPTPVAVEYPDSGFRKDAHAIELWKAHGYDTGGEPFYSADQLHSYASGRSKAAVELNRESRPAGEAVAWLPIETAPRAGEWIAVINAESGICARSKWSFGNWIEWPYIHGEPTHWFPLPSSINAECNCPGRYKPANLHAPNCPVRASRPEPPAVSEDVMETGASSNA